MILLTWMASKFVSSFPLEAENISSSSLPPSSGRILEPKLLQNSPVLPKTEQTEGNLDHGRGRKSRQMPFMIYGGCSPYTGLGQGGGIPQFGGGFSQFDSGFGWGQGLRAKPTSLAWCKQDNDCTSLLAPCNGNLDCEKELILCDRQDIKCHDKVDNKYQKQRFYGFPPPYWYQG
ncbi:uncharacterized protein LOC110859568 [Folsomia candida]|uniref:Uncharacterized protein n=1 Tax=Folsomia candida TaxID=158441 RepID=A0A226DBU5_FOLCA|nr:uncharacterized protein LOC110859568 [Folsomia candida]OXA42378.1 hypothetical protein Fcan01_22826 [Folsomia candida]